MRAGETPVQSAARLLTRELGIKMSQADARARISSLCHFSFQWAMRVQAPADHGTADISAVLCVQLSEEECARCQLDKSECEECKWETVENILADPSYHPALKRICRELLRQRLFRQMSEACESDGARRGEGEEERERQSDKEVVRLCREYVRLSEQLNREDR